MTWMIFLVVLFCSSPVPAYAQSPAMPGMAGSGQMEGGGKEAKAVPMRGGMYGPYSMTREGSGTSWQPDSSPMEMLSFEKNHWELMLHGFAFGIYDYQSGPRGDEKVFSTSMLTGMGQRNLGPGTLGLRSMFSLDPLMGKRGYPLLLQTGETADGRTPLIDRQHPHDFFMELSASYRFLLSKNISLFAYVGYPGEPAIGPPAYMHRFSAADNPEAPLSHHWLDSTHISFGVATLGLVWNRFKFEGSYFNGREPDQNRWDFDPLRLDSYSARLSFNPARNWSLQASLAHLHAPEQLHPNVNVNRYTFSVIYNRPTAMGNWQSMLAWGRNDNRPGNTLDAFLLESAWQFFTKHTLFTRLERVEKDELFPEQNPPGGRTFTVNKASFGYIYDILFLPKIKLGVGISGGLYFLPASLDNTYGEHPYSVMLFLRIKTQP